MTDTTNMRQAVLEVIAIGARRSRETAQRARDQAKRLQSISPGSAKAARLLGMAEISEENANKMEEMGPMLAAAFEEATASVQEAVDVTKMAERSALALEGIFGELVKLRRHFTGDGQRRPSPQDSSSGQVTPLCFVGSGGSVSWSR